MHRYRRLLGYVRPYRVAFVISVVAAVVASTLDGFTLALLIPFLRLLFGEASGIAEAPTVVERALALVVGGFLDTGDRGSALRNVVFIILGTVAVKNLAVYGAGYLGQYIQEGVARDLRTGLYAHVQRMGLGFFQRTKGGQLLSRMVADTDYAKWVVSAALVSVLQSTVLIAVYVAILFSLSWPLTLVTLTVAPAIVLIMRPILRRVRTRLRDAMESRGELAAVMDETVEGARLVKAHGAEEYERRRLTDAAQGYFWGILKAQRFAVLASPVSETLGAGVIVLLLLVGTWAVTGTGILRPELFVAFVAISLRLLPPVKALSQFPAHAEQSLAAAERVFQILDRPADDVDPSDALPFPGLEREIEFRDVWLAYEGEDWVLRGVDLTVRRGEVVALVGPSGAGKSTLVDLLPRFVEPGRGVVLADGVALSRYSRRSLRRSLGIVSQHTVLFHDTVRNNIAYGDQAGASDDAVRAAAEAANAHDFIAQLPRGYHTILGERGMRLSGGERQRVAIARALLRDPPILILDEATSSLDPGAERLVQQAIARLLENRTVLVIAHRLSTVARADKIAVLDGGRVVEQGCHAELVAAGGLYQRLLSLELSATAV
ncbi:MAG: ATP-binding cassette domain-containing protein [Gemmatimonadales bacterium]|nr:ATP-binding cassette domain-containing protein [Gemmatimonadales bacterium]NIN10738.1 ATP-binding cassette domain-containing protein [Gemmatimonadales bacterium]NIQ98968.1 ATP-binding cassette domain-containing protein [Gemmatimonadales bacterium]NIS63787.1 ATP-binding cassette domain-containing protein [Gemmatimonadales bacterium]